MKDLIPLEGEEVVSLNIIYILKRKIKVKLLKFTSRLSAEPSSESRAFNSQPWTLYKQFIGKIRWSILNIWRIDVERQKSLDTGIGLLLLCFQLLEQSSWGLSFLELKCDESHEHTLGIAVGSASIPRLKELSNDFLDSPYTHS